MISYFSDIAENCYEQAAIAQSVVRNIGSVEVTSSILVSSSELVENKGISRNFSLKCLYFYQIVGEWNSPKASTLR